MPEDKPIKESKYDKLFQQIFEEINIIGDKVEGTLSFGRDVLTKNCEATPNSSPLERDLKIVLEKLKDLKNSIN